MLEIERIWVSVNEPKPSKSKLKMERNAASSVADTAGTSTLGTVSVMPLNDRAMMQKLAAIIILATLSEKMTTDVYLMNLLLTMVRHFHLTYTLKCILSIGEPGVS